MGMAQPRLNKCWPSSHVYLYNQRHQPCIERQQWWGPSIYGGALQVDPRTSARARGAPQRAVEAHSLLNACSSPVHALIGIALWSTVQGVVGLRQLPPNVSTAYPRVSPPLLRVMGGGPPTTPMHALSAHSCMIPHAGMPLQWLGTQLKAAPTCGVRTQRVLGS